jgi:Arylsulfotransferase (ASST)
VVLVSVLRASGKVTAGLAAAALAAAGAGPAPGAAATGPVSAWPEPGATAASPGTQISLRGASASDVGTVEVAGSRSGPHPGRLVGHSDGAGVSFLPDAPFREGERVTVRTSLQVRGGRDGDFGFTVATGALERAGQGRGIVPKGRFAQQRFRSRQDLRPPAVTVVTRRSGHTRGVILLATREGKRDGPLILDDHGDLVWFRPEPRGLTATDLRVATDQGKPVLTWWEGRFAGAWGYGEGIIADASYRPIARVHAGNGYQADLHEFQLTSQGTALLIAYHRVERDLRSVGGPRHGRVLDNVVQEIDLANGLVRFEWHALDHVPLRESYAPPQKGRAAWDWCHINSAQLTPDGHLLVSARNTHAIYEIDRSTGDVVWQLGGRGSTFRMGRGTDFAWQHDAELHDDGTVTVFDNEAAPPVRTHSRVLRIRLDIAHRRATLVSAREHRQRLLSPSQGNVQVLSGGREFVGWGQNPWFTEFAPDGTVLFDAHLARGYDSYRAYRASWTGMPAGAPSVAAQPRGSSSTAVWASWNGATEIAGWQVLAGDDPGALTPVRTVARHGFETAMSIPARPRWIAVRALAADGSTLGTSAPVRPRRS